MSSPLSTPEQRKMVLQKAEYILDLRSEARMPSSFTEYESCIRDLTLELTILEGLYTILHEAYNKLADQFNEARQVLDEDLPKGHMTARLYALLYTIEEIEEMTSCSGDGSGSAG